MFNPLTRALKLGLTAITILTSGGFAFAPMAAEAQENSAHITNCTNYPFGTSASYGPGGCAVTLGTERFSTAKERYCEQIANSTKPICKPTATRWRFENSNAPNSPDTATSGDNRRRNQILQGTGTRVSRGTGLTVSRPGSLNLSTATFRGLPLNGDATDGVDYFRGQINNTGRLYAYSGLFSGTDLGKPITARRGVASWVGKFRVNYGLVNENFVLEVDYTERRLSAFVPMHSGFYYQLDASYDTSGYISGDIELSRYYTVDRTNRELINRTGEVTGLIGEQGAVGAFISSETVSGSHQKSNPTFVVYAGGFVARPAEDVTGAVAVLNDECEDNPLDEFCFLSNERAVKIIKDCNGTRTPTSPAHCTVATVDCVNNPFGETCHDVLGGHTLNIVLGWFCGRNETTQDSHECRDVVGRATAANWAKKNRDITNDIVFAKGNQILKGWLTGLKEVGINNNNLRSRHKVLLNSAIFNGKPLGGDRPSNVTDGVAMFVSGNTVHAGILSATDLGAPLRGRAGTTASWVGHIHSGGFQTNQDFVLEVTFGNNNTGSVEAFVPYNNGALRYGAGHLHLKGDFDSTGVIIDGTGKVTAKKYNNSDRNNLSSGIVDSVNPNPDAGDGILTGLIGEKGAIGAFVSIGGYYLGGFAARPAEDVEGAQAFLNRTCGDTTSNLSDPGDPFHEFCYLRKTEQTARIANCTVDSNADISACQRAVALNPCITNPFKSGCNYNANFRDIYPAAKENRIEYCNNTGSALNDPLCQYTEVIAGICEHSPFAPVCLKGDHNSAGRTPEKFATCRTANPSDLTCHGVSREPSETKVNTAAWVNDFVKIDNPIGLSLVADPNKGSQFLKGGNLRLDQTGVTVVELDQLYFSDIPHLKLASSATASPNGVAFFWAESSSTSEILASGILSGTDLGAPASGASGTTAVWQGVFQSVFIATRTEFELKVTFDGSTESSNTGSIKAFIERKSTDNRYSSIPHYYLDGTFDANGLIKGQVTAAKFGEENGEINLGNPLGTSYKGVLRGLIGEGGAVGAFVGGEVPVNAADNGNTFTGVSQFAGGFVAHSFTVNYDAWVDAADPLAVATTSATTNRFLTTTGNVLNKGTVSGSSIAVTMDSAEYRETETAVGVPLGGDVTDGFAYLRGSVNHVGILATTSLGAPLNSKTAEGTWKGSFVSAEGSNAITKESFILNVDFGKEKVSATIPTTPTTGYDFKGTFNTRGVIDGTITHTGLNKSSDGIMKGLIGSEGAVGVFISNADADLSYGGGFVARPTR